jgi:hypothetical protein
MKRIKIRVIAGAVVLSLLMLSVGIYIGTQLGQKTEVMFYAKVAENHETSLLVQGIPENDINHRGDFVVSLKNPNDKNAVLDAAGNAIQLGELPVGAEVQITYDASCWSPILPRSAAFTRSA